MSTITPRQHYSNLRFTAVALKLFPPLVRGAKFGRDFRVPNPPPASDVAKPPVPVNPLLEHFNQNREGPGIWKWLHYFEIYHRHFHRFVGKEVHVLEVGIYSGGSLPMWRKYFGEKCHIYGVDIEPACLTYRAEGIEVFIGDQADRAFWAKTKQAIPRVDILIDDGGHRPEQQIITLEEMLPHLQPGGIYLCEDVHGVANRYSAYVGGLAGSLNAAAPGQLPAGTAGNAVKPSAFQASIHSIHHYPFVTVIEKRAQPLDQLLAPKHGTQWQPFL